jgi:DNA modification methylase
VIYLADCVELMRLMPAGSVDAVFVDQPYRLSNGGVTVKNGRLESVDKGAWGRSLGSFEKDHAFNERWVGEARRVPKPDGTIWVSGTYHVIFSIGFALQSSGFRIINSVVREKPDPSPNAPYGVHPPEGGSDSILTSERGSLTCKPGPRELEYAPFVPSSWMVARADEGSVPGRHYRG